MDPMLLFIGLAVALAVGLLTVQAHQRLSYRRRVVRGRVAQVGAYPNSAAESVLRRRRHVPLPLLDMLSSSSDAANRTNRELAQAGWPIRVGEYLSLRVASAAALVAIGMVFVAGLDLGPFWVKVAVTVALAACGWMLPRLYLARRRQRRLDLIEKQLPDALTAMAKSLRAGSGLFQALAFSADETDAPLGPELQSALRDLQLGAEPEDVFEALSERVGSPDLDIAITAIVIQRTVGGNLSEILTNVSNTIRERAKLRGEVGVLTSRQRLTGNLVAIMPVGIAAAFIAINPDVGGLLVTTAAGQISLAIGIMFELLGIWLIRRLATIEV